MVLTSAHLHLGVLTPKRNLSEKPQSQALAYDGEFMEETRVGPEMPSLPSLENPTSSDCQTPPKSTSFPVFDVPYWSSLVELGAIPKGSGSEQLLPTLAQVTVVI